MKVDEYCIKSMSKVPEYYRKIKKNKVPGVDDLVKATEALINDEESNYDQ